MMVQFHNHGNYVDQKQNNNPAVAQLKGQVPPPTNLERILIASSMHEWWRELRDSVATTELSRLHWDILSFCKAYELTTQQKQLRMDALEYVERVVHEIWPSAEVYLFGSTATGLSLPWSDIDVAIMSPNRNSCRSWQKPTTMQWLSALSRSLYRRGKCQSLWKIPHAKVPLLKVVFTSGISCDISFDVHNCSSGVSVVRCFTEQYKTFRPLCLVLKYFLGQNNMNELHTGGLGSFCIINMIVSHLQKVSSNEPRCQVGDLGTLLLSFFARYSSVHNYVTDVVSTRADFCGSKRTKGWMNSKFPDLLAVEDPLDPTLDIGKGSYRIREIRMKFAEAQKVLLTHWHHEPVLAQLIDTTGDPNKKSKQGISVTTGRPKRKKNNYMAGGEQDGQLARRVHRKLLQPSVGIVARGPADRILSGTGVVNSISSISSNYYFAHERFECEQEDFQSQKIPQTPRPHNLGEGIELLGRNDDKTIVSDFLEANSTPKKKRRKTYLEHEVSEECGHREQNSRLRHPAEGMDRQVERTLVDFWESHLTSRSKSGKISLKHCDSGGEAEHGQPEQKSRPWAELHAPQRGRDTNPNTEDDKSRVEVWKAWLEDWEARLATLQKSGNGSLQHHGTLGDDRDDQPVQGIQAEFGACQQGWDTNPKSQDEKLLQEFWEVQLATKRKSRNGFLQHHGTLGDIKDDQPVHTIHAELQAPRQSREANPNTQDEKLVVEFWESHMATNRKSRNGSLQHHGNPGVIKDDQPVHGILVELQAPQQGTQTNPNTQDKKLVEEFWEEHLTTKLKSTTCSLQHHGTPGNNKDDQLVHGIHPKQSPLDREDVENAHSEERLVVPCLESTNLSLKHNVIEGENEGVLPVQLNHPQQGRDAAGRSGEERMLVDFWEANLSRGLKSRQGSLRQEGIGGEEKSEPVTMINLEQLPSGSQVVGRSQNERKLHEFWETHLTPRLMTSGGPWNQHEAGCEVEDAPPAQKIAEGRRKDDQERILIDFWEVHLNPSLKLKKGSLKHLVTAVEEEDNSHCQISNLHKGAILLGEG